MSEKENVIKLHELRGKTLTYEKKNGEILEVHFEE